MFFIIGKACLLIFGLWWCKEVLERLGKDIGRLRGRADATEKVVIIFIWILTLGIMVWIGYFVYGLVRPILEYL